MPPQFSGLSLSLTARFSASTASAKLKTCFGWPVTSGCRHLPGSMRYQPRLVTALPSSVATAAMILCGVSLHQVSPVAGRRLHGVDHGGEEIRRLHDVGGEPAALQERGQRALRLRPVDAVDRRGVVARDHQQPLDAGEPRLLVVIFAVLGEIGDEIAVVGLRRRDLGEWRRRLAGAALARGGDDEIVRRDAQRVAAVLRDRRGAVDAERARIEQDAVGSQRALHAPRGRRRDRSGTSRASRSPPCRRCRSRPRPHSSCGCRVSGRRRPAARTRTAKSPRPAATSNASVRRRAAYLARHARA